MIETELTVRNEGGNTVRLTEAAFDKIREIAASGGNLSAIHRALNISDSTLRRHRQKDPRIDEAIQDGLADFEQRLVDIIMRHAENGKSGWVAALALGKVKLGWRDNGPSHVTQNTQVNINISEPMSDADFESLITGRAISDE